MPGLEIWNKYMCAYDFLTKVDSYNRNLEDIADALNPVLGVRVLDAGSGTGNLSILLKARGGSVLSCDFSKEAIDRHCAKDPKAEVHQISLEEPLPFPDESFDRICCASVLFALTHAGCRLALSEFMRTLRPGGHVVVTVPSGQQRNHQLLPLFFRAQMNRHGIVLGILQGTVKVWPILRILYYNWRLGRLPEGQGFRRFTGEQLRNDIAAAGFTGIRISTTYGGRFHLAIATRSAGAPDHQKPEEGKAHLPSLENALLKGSTA